jgi:DNA repair protein RecO
MPHHIYTTPGFLVHSAPHGESGKFFLVFTRDLGMIGATAQGVRLLQSKLRYNTEDYSLSLFSFVRGKEVWRMTGAHEIEGVENIAPDNMKLWVQILALVKRLVPGEEHNENLFQVLEKLHEFLAQRMEKKELVEYLTVLRILNLLGYLVGKDFAKYYGSEINQETLGHIEDEKDLILRAINNGLKQSQL